MPTTTIQTEEKKNECNKIVKIWIENLLLWTNSFPSGHLNDLLDLKWQNKNAHEPEQRHHNVHMEMVNTEYEQMQ